MEMLAGLTVARRGYRRNWLEGTGEEEGGTGRWLSTSCVCWTRRGSRGRPQAMVASRRRRPELLAMANGDRGHTEKHKWGGGRELTGNTMTSSGWPERSWRRQILLRGCRW